MVRTLAQITPRGRKAAPAGSGEEDRFGLAQLDPQGQLRLGKLLTKQAEMTKAMGGPVYLTGPPGGLQGARNSHHRKVCVAGREKTRPRVQWPQIRAQGLQERFCRAEGGIGPVAGFPGHKFLSGAARRQAQTGACSAATVPKPDRSAGLRWSLKRLLPAFSR